VKLSVAQIGSIARDISANLTKHIEAVHRALRLGTDVVVFPELWNSQGELVGQLDEKHEGVLVFDILLNDIATWLA
jgi:predicted amidohydrolase